MRRHALLTAVCAVMLCQVIGCQASAGRETEPWVHSDLKPGEVRWGEVNHDLRAGLAAEPLPGQVGFASEHPLYLRLQWLGDWQVPTCYTVAEKGGEGPYVYDAGYLRGERWNRIAEVTITLPDGSEHTLPCRQLTPEEMDSRATRLGTTFYKTDDTLSFPLPAEVLAEALSGTTPQSPATLRVTYHLDPRPGYSRQWHGTVQTPAVKVSAGVKPSGARKSEAIASGA